MRIYFFILFLLLLGACSDDNTFVPEELPRRTVIVYLGVDNNFKGEEKEKIADLVSGWDESFDGRLLVYADNGGAPFLTEIYTDKGGGASRLVKNYENGNSADPEVFRQVIADIVKDYPARSYGLVVLSHGTGWLPQGALTRSVISDKGNEMEIWDMAEALPVKMDFIVFDACNMGTIEVAYEFKDKADYLVISPAEVLVPGFVYTTMMEHLMKTEPDLIAVAREFYKYYDEQTGFFRSATVSVVRTEILEEVAELAREICKGVNAEQQVDLNTVQNFGYGSRYIFFDFGDFIGKLAPGRYNEFMNTLDKCLIYKAATTGYYSGITSSYQDIKAYSGLAVYVPQSAYPLFNDAYYKTKWAERMN